jgi:DNA-directed RNA polymerase specialized sigma24 family protein
MFYFEDFSIKEIAEITRSREGTVKSSLNRLRGMLKDNMLGGKEYD